MLFLIKHIINDATLQAFKSFIFAYFSLNQN
jgi:hypothetical protein